MVSGWGVTAVVCSLIASAVSLIGMFTPLWVYNDGVGSVHSQTVASSETGWGLAMVCIEAKFKQGTTDVSAFDTKECYTYYGNHDYTYIGHTSTRFFKRNSTQAVCNFFKSEREIASKEIALMTGIRVADTTKFLDSTCGSTGQASLAMAILFFIMMIITFIAMLLLIFCCKKHAWLATLSRITTTLAAIFSVILVFTVAAQFKSLRDAGDGVNVSYHFCYYGEWIAFLFALIAEWSIEKHVLNQKGLKSDII